MQVQRTRHTRAYVQIPNEIARHSSLSLEAVGLLTRLLSLPDANRVTVERVTSAVPNGRRTVSNAMNELVAAGYVKRARVQDPESGRWVTLTSVTDSPTDHMPTVGLPTGQAVGGYPKGEVQEGNDLLPEAAPEPEGCEGESQQQEGEEIASPNSNNDNSASGTADAVTARAVVTLGRLGSFERRLRLSPQEVMRLAPKAAKWLSDGLHEMEVITALTRALPATIESAAALVTHRLEKFQPEKAEIRQPAAPAAPRVQRSQCQDCGRPFRLGVTADLCADCRTNA
ncbi:hypothetical protein [Streptomyces sp. NRRL S-241]|uniref:hypothetical protein n=1 Tax=Streptomyces sp. NRRL S-241 TaxID=1463896 RepID=UPI0004C17804|nr:hypothetical protein [Streptomyces sp. NRRL S-241]